jgi:predicted methyltransferase
VRGHLSGAPFPVECLEHDLREPLPPRLRGAFDTVVTDPPYTVPAARLFLARAAESLAGPGGTVFFSFGSRRPEAPFQVQRTILDAGFAIRRLVRDFNEYVGAGVLGGTSHLYELAATNAVRPAVTGRFDGALYTADAPT